ncbi:hypothetical protein AVEN_62146-1 [Araneus ventricosus]|uniref:Phosphatidylinositol-specific phospholipase C X domain-containing protein n=1 Tax=Araneus ventricosus TaxID=182803 RepID=A0A4Y2P7C3_ARAVE|nr:hypothetical protein AVEN_62146-1 [Araneus ventricosus]
MKIKFISSILICLLFGVEGFVDNKFENGKQHPKVYITVSSIATSYFFQPCHRKIILNYYDADCERIARSFPFVGLYSHDPTVDLRNHLAIHKPIACPDGKFETNVSLPYFEFNTQDTVSKCLGFWAVYVEAGNVVHSSCLCTHPDWMYNMKDMIGGRPLKSLMIPGTHDSGCYMRYNPYKNTVYERYIFTQEESVYNQLVYGVRYLDLRIWHEGAYKRTSRIFITHDVFHLGLPVLEEVLQQIKDFVLVTKEIIVVDFHRKMTGFFKSLELEEWQHEEIIELGKKIFGNFLIDRKYANMPLEFLWKIDKRILFAYRGYDEPIGDDLIAFNVHHWWIDTQNVTILHKYLASCCCLNRYGLTATNAVLTPNIWFSRRRLSNLANSVIDNWFRNELSCSNVVLTDYFLATDCHIGVTPALVQLGLTRKSVPALSSQSDWETSVRRNRTFSFRPSSTG